MVYKYVFVAALASAITLFALQNSAPTSIRFLFWSLRDVPLGTVILVSVAAGVVPVGVPLWLERWRLRARVGSLEKRLMAVQGLLEERNRDRASPPTAA